MRKTILTLCSFLVVFLMAGPSSATVIGSGTFDLIVPGSYTAGGVNNSTSYTDPVTGQTISVSNYFAMIYEGDPYAGIAFGLIYDNGNYAGSGSYQLSSVSGSHNLTTGSEVFALSAVASPGRDYASSQVDFASSASYYGELKEFGYNYSFTGQKDDINNNLQFVIQMEILGYFPDDDQSTSDWKGVYSDYGTYMMVYATQEERSQNYRTNWLNESVTDVGTSVNIAGRRTFNYSAFGERQWIIYWDFGAYGYDKSGGGDIPTVPEPATMLLLGLGLMGLAGMRRFKK